MLERVETRISEILIERRRDRMMRKFGGIQTCTWCRQCAQDGDGWNFAPWSENFGYDVLTCGVCSGTSLWMWGMGMHFVCPLDPPKPAFEASEVYPAPPQMNDQVKQAFIDGLAYGMNCEVADPEEVWRTSSTRARQAPPENHTMASQAIADVLSERRKQIEVKDFDASHDDMATRGQLATAAACYVIHQSHLGSELKRFWPWDMSWWKPTDRRRDLVKAAALIVAEIERLDRAALATTEGQPDA